MAKVFLCISLVKTAPAPIKELLPIVTFFIIVVPIPIQHASSIVTFPAILTSGHSACMQVHKTHILKAMDILIFYFNVDIETFVPPGDIWCEITEKYASQAGLKFLNSYKARFLTRRKSNGLIYIGDENVICFHDKDIVEKGFGWLEHKILKVKEKNLAFCFVKDVGNDLLREKSR